MIHFPNLFPLQNINKQAVHTNIIMWYTSLQDKWENKHNYIHITAFWFVFCKVNTNSSEYRHPSQRLHISSPLAPFQSTMQRTQDTLHTDEPSPSIPLFEHWKRQHNQREAGYTFTALLQVLGIPSIILCYHLQVG